MAKYIDITSNHGIDQLTVQHIISVRVNNHYSTVRIMTAGTSDVYDCTSNTAALSARNMIIEAMEAHKVVFDLGKKIVHGTVSINITEHQVSSTIDTHPGYAEGKGNIDKGEGN